MSNLPEFKLTMLGLSGSGKTAYMHAMYQRLHSGCNGLALRAVDNQVDLALRKGAKKLYLDHEWPERSPYIQKQYLFTLKIEGRPVAMIDWVDYRGGALEPDEATAEDYQALCERLRSSHAVFWMMDLTGVGSSLMRSDTAILRSGIGTYAQLSGEAREQPGASRSWVFIRTKSDEVRSPTGDVDWERAVDDLVGHALETARSHLGSDSLMTFVPVSASGRMNGLRLSDDGPAHVEWPILQSLADLFRVRAAEIRARAGAVAEALPPAAEPGAFDEILRWVFAPQLDYSTIATREEFRRLSAQVGYIDAIVERLTFAKPPVVRQVRRAW